MSNEISPAPAGGIIRPQTAVCHREEEYDPAGFEHLQKMQERHFWYRGRHRFLLRAIRDAMERRLLPATGLAAVDLGCGCGGWVRDLSRGLPGSFRELALADSSLKALELAARSVGPHVTRYQVDLLNLEWEARWDVAFLLDVVEHVGEDERVFEQVWKALRPGGLLLVSAPAFMRFWTINDDVARHLRRYVRSDFEAMALRTKFELLDTRYFMFFLSPLLLASRWSRSSLDLASEGQRAKYLSRAAHTPPAPINAVLQAIFSLETPLGLRVRFPWGTSLMGLFRKPGSNRR